MSRTLRQNSADSMGFDQPTGIALLHVDLLDKVLKKLPVIGSIGARAVCRRWRDSITLDDARFSDECTPSYCPLIFKRTDSNEHTWLGYDKTSGQWKSLPQLPPLPHVHHNVTLMPVAGNGKGLLAFKIVTDLELCVVGAPMESVWTTLPRSTDSWGEAALILLGDGRTFRVIAIREEETEIFSSEYNQWTKLTQRPPDSLNENVVDSIKQKLCVTFCEGFLYFYANKFLISFDIRAEQWTNDRIALPDHRFPKAFQLVECAGNLFCAIEDIVTSSITLWGLGIRSRMFTLLIAMPKVYYLALNKNVKGQPPQLRSVGNKCQIFLWRNKKLNIVVFDLLKRTWDVLPELEESVDSREDSQFEMVVDAGSFQPTSGAT